MSDTVQQPGLQSLSKSFEPAALEAHWGPVWEQRGYGVAGYRGSQVPKACTGGLVFGWKRSRWWSEELSGG